MITKETLAKMTREEVGYLLFAKQVECRTCGEEYEMICSDPEYQMIKERLLEFGKAKVLKRSMRDDRI